MISPREPAPSIFQQMIARKKEIRVTVIGEDIFASELVLPAGVTDVDDIHRYGVRNINKRAISLSNNFERKCFDIIKSLGLVYGTIDIIEGLDEQYYFLEINSIGDWYWIEKETNQPITQAIVDTIKNMINC
jgi:glutathione synthase/RimK-type ligase-like ATP-grasp enzyme